MTGTGGLQRHRFQMYAPTNAAANTAANTGDGATTNA